MAEVLGAPGLPGIDVAGESVSIAAANLPRTRTSLLADLRTLGVQPGMTLMVHASLSRMGWVAGGPVAVVLALLDAVGEKGTMAMPSFSGDLTEPKYWRHPPVPEHWHQMIRDETPVFDPALTPTRMMAKVSDTFRIWPDTVRSNHPHVSVCARGPLPWRGRSPTVTGWMIRWANTPPLPACTTPGPGCCNWAPTAIPACI